VLFLLISWTASAILTRPTGLIRSGSGWLIFSLADEQAAKDCHKPEESLEDDVSFEVA
jgi:hypothetical protein